MKKKNLKTLALNKEKVSNLENLNAISGGTAGAESRIICPCGDNSGGGGGGGNLTITCNWQCNPTQAVCEITQVTCGCG